MWYAIYYKPPGAWRWKKWGEASDRTIVESWAEQLPEDYRFKIVEL